MTAADQIAELQRQRAEKHRLIDDEYDKRVRMVPHVCEYTEKRLNASIFGFASKNVCKHCGAAMPGSE